MIITTDFSLKKENIG